jgi:hypothetical protein
MYHCFSCSNQHEHTVARHDSIVRELSSFLADTVDGIVVVREQNVYHPTDRSRHQRADLVVTPLVGSEMVVDVRVCNVGCASHQSTRPESLLEMEEEAKIQKYSDSMGRNADDPNRFIPFIVLTSGNIGPRGTSWIEKLAGMSKLSPEVFSTYLKRRISVALAKALYQTACDFEDSCAIKDTPHRERPRG